MCMLLGMVTHLLWGRIFKISSYVQFYWGKKKSKPSCGAWNCLVPTRSLFFYPVRIGNLNTLSIISWRRCYGSLHSSMSASSLVYLTGSELRMGTLVPADLPNQLREGFLPLPSSLQVPKGPSHGGGCGNCIIRLQIQSSWQWEKLSRENRTLFPGPCLQAVGCFFCWSAFNINP